MCYLCWMRARERSVCACSKAGAHILLPLSARPHLRQANSFRIMGRILIRRRARTTWNSSIQMKTQSSSFIYIMSLGANEDPLSSLARNIIEQVLNLSTTQKTRAKLYNISLKFLETCLTAKTYFQVRLWRLFAQRIVCSLTAGWISPSATAHKTDGQVA